MALFSVLFAFYSKAQNNLIFFTNNGTLFTVQIKNKFNYSVPQADVKITNLDSSRYKVKIQFTDSNLNPIDTTLALFYPTKPIKNQDIIYLVNTLPKTSVRYLATLPSSDVKLVIPEPDTSIQVKTRHERTVQQIIFLNDTNSLCASIIDSTSFATAIQHITSTVNADRKIVLTEEFIKHNCFSSSQASVIIELIPFEVEKLKIMKALLKKLDNVFVASDWADYLKYEASQKIYKIYYDNYIKMLSFHNGVDSIEYSKKIIQIKSETDEFRKSKIMFYIASHYSLKAVQVRELMSLLNHDKNKESFIKAAYFATTDKKNLYHCLSVIQFSEVQTRIKIWLDNQQ